MESELLRQIIADLKTYFEKAVDCRRVVKHTSEQWYALGAVRPPPGDLVNLLHNMVSPFRQSWKRRRLNMCPLLLRPVQLLVAAVIILLQERERRMFPGVHLNCRVRLKCQVHLPVAENVLWLKISTLHLPWNLRLPEEKRGKVGEIEKLRRSFREGCHNLNCFVWAPITAALLDFSYIKLFFLFFIVFHFIYIVVDS